MCPNPWEHRGRWWESARFQAFFWALCLFRFDGESCPAPCTNASCELTQAVRAIIGDGKYLRAVIGKDIGYKLQMNELEVPPGFHRLGFNARTYLLDTNVWSSIASSNQALNAFLPWLQKEDAIAALSMFTIFELSRANHMYRDFDQLLTAAGQRIYIPLLYDELSDLEMFSYPNEVELLWNPITNSSNHNEIMFISTISKDPLFIHKRQELLEFGYAKFMNLEAFKGNFPLADDNGKFTEDSAETFAWANTLDYLLRYFPEYILPFKGNLRTFDTSKLKSIYVRSLFLYFKYYMHGQSPNKSDFMDYANLSYLPYVDVYVTERNVLNTLSQMKAGSSRLLKCDLVHVREFVKVIEKSFK